MIDDQSTRARTIIERLRDATKNFLDPASTHIVREFGCDPFLILISCLLSLRTKDTVSLPASQRLFAHAKTPQQILDLSVEKIEKIIYPVAFYRKRANQLHVVSNELIKNFNGIVPSGENELLSLSGVGRKTMNLVQAEGFAISAICVDTHVHRICNRLGLVTTKTPQETESELKKILPEQYWIECNKLLVMWGQNICVPISPFCSRCAVADLCQKVGVKKSR